MKFNTDTVLINDKQVSEYILSENNNQLDNRYYTKNEIEDKLNNKSNIDLSNLSETGRKSFFPSNTFIDITNSLSWSETTSGTVASYIAPANGFLFAEGKTNDTNVSEISVWKYTGIGNTDTCGLAGILMKSMTILKKGDPVNVFYTSNMTRTLIRFVYAEGEV